ncbi:unnamed protein product [Oikopleura dioica]|uniref:Uncharacterized protein n=1 Tax=Oikopleura dioica TaxID=34765 RepID=E4WWS7_OIKDI|nr:unnamed protein product [Oikopleura dioica]
MIFGIQLQIIRKRKTTTSDLNEHLSTWRSSRAQTRVVCDRAAAVTLSTGPNVSLMCHWGEGVTLIRSGGVRQTRKTDKHTARTVNCNFPSRPIENFEFQ